MPRQALKKPSITIYSTSSELSEVCLAEAACPARQVGTTTSQGQHLQKLTVASSPPPAHQTTEQKSLYGHSERDSFSRRQSQTLQLLYQTTLRKTKCNGLNVL